MPLSSHCADIPLFQEAGFGTTESDFIAHLLKTKVCESVVS